MGDQVNDFLTEKEQAQIIDAIKTAEMQTSGEIRVHIEEHHKEEPLARAQQLFGELGMHATELKNGVLIYIATADHRFAIIGDEGIDAVTSNDFWDRTKEEMQSWFRKGKFAEGLVAGILRAGKELRTHFPYLDGDQNELSDEISIS